MLKKFNFMFFVFLNLKLIGCFNSVLSFDWSQGRVRLRFNFTRVYNVSQTARRGQFVKL